MSELERFLGPLRVAPLYRTSPVSPIAQADFLNTVALGRVVAGAGAPGPEEVLAFAKALELAAGRRRGRRFGPRSLDVDLLLFGDERRQRPELTLPHPRLAERRFVLAPLADLAPRLTLPGAGATVRELLGRLAAAERAERVGWS